VNRWKPCKRRVYIKKLRELGFDGPFTGAKHQFMTYSGHRLAIPSNDEYSVPQLRFMIKEVELILRRGISLDEWKKI
jgi:hypothetical protein